ncbi:MAG: PAP/fibrillin family protein [Cyanobacteria bacterium P01_A01_bin.3]
MTAQLPLTSAAAAAKTALLEAIAAAPKPGGLPDASKEIEQCITQLEVHNPIAVPTGEAELLSGNWRTLYTTNQELMNLGRAIPGFKTDGIYQCIWAEKQLLCNVGKIDGLPYLGGFVAVRATFDVLSDVRVKVNFTQAMIGSQAIANFTLDSFLSLMEYRPKQIPAVKIKFSEQREQKGWLDITYLDRDLRVGRGNQGNVFVLERVNSPAT